MRKIDVHAHYGKWPFAGKDATIIDIEETIHKYETDAILISSAKAIMYDFIEGNKELFEDISGRPGLYGYVVVNANYIDKSIIEIKKYMDCPNFVGAKYHPDYCRKPANCKELNEVYSFLKENDIPVLIHAFDEDCLHLLDINRDFPNLKIIAAHMGGPRYDLGCRLAQEANENVYLEICATCIDADKIRQAVDAAGKERVLYGTDYSLFDPSYTIGAVESADLSEEEKLHIYRLNAQKIFKGMNLLTKK